MRRALQSLKAPFVHIGHAYNETARKAPMITGVVTTVVKTSAADLFAQKVIERREDVDWRRHSMFVMFGFGYLGCWQFYLYNNLFVKWCKPITAAVGHGGSAVVKTFIDQFIHHPLLYFPCFYTLKGLVSGEPLSESMAYYREHLWDNCKALWMIWVPAQMVNFTVVPLHLRIPFVAGVSFAWTVVISVMRGALDDSPMDSTPIDTRPEHAQHGGGGGHAITAAAAVAAEAAAGAAASASAGVARSSALLLNAASASADGAVDAAAASPAAVGLQQLVAGGEEAPSGTMLLR